MDITVSVGKGFLVKACSSSDGVYFETIHSDGHSATAYSQEEAEQKGNDYEKQKEEQFLNHQKNKTKSIIK
jgi:hypothetical protein